MTGPWPAWLVGITGGIGTGKTTLSRMLARENAWPLLQADAYGHEGLRPGSPLLADIRRRFGSSVFAPDGGVDRPRLAELVFADRAALADLNRLVHPWIFRRIGEEAAALRGRAYDDIILLDAALLIDWLDEIRPRWIVVVVAPMAERLARLASKGMTREAAMRRIRSQRPDSELLDRADWVVENRGSLAELGEESRRLAEQIRSRRRSTGESGSLASGAD